MSAAEEHRLIADTFTARVLGTPSDAWDNPAPPAGWVARDVVRHLVEWFPPFLERGSGVKLASGPSVDTDPVSAWTVHSNAVQSLLDDQHLESRAFSHPNTGEMPLHQAIGRFYTSDVFLHTWDLARATGQNETLDPTMCAERLVEMEPWDDVLRSSGQYGPRIDVPADADVQTRLLAFIGRDPR